jgi:hypothetical protein
MKKVFVTIVITFFYSNGFPQFIYYAAAKAGLSMREQPNTSSKVLEKINYGEKLVTVINNDPLVTIATEGFNGYWWKVNYNNKTGYVVNSYLLPMPPPKAGIKTLHSYFDQVSTRAGSPLLIKKSEAALSEMGESTIFKQLYKNGMEWHEEKGYENGSNLYCLPDFTIEQCFLLVRLLGQYPDLISEKDTFPVKNTNTKIEAGKKTLEVQREKYDGKPGPVQKIKIIVEQGAITEFEIFTLGTQAVIFRTSGV